MPTQAWRDANPERARKYRTDWYEKNKAAEIPKALERKRRYIKRNAAITRAERERPCADCGVTYPYHVMDFDHIGDDKTAGIAAMVQQPVSEKKLREEIAKCEVVCSNCHRIRTYERRMAAGLEDPLGV
jgi:hypothetical protein